MKIILKGMTGSHAYGLNTDSSDYDWGGIFVSPLQDVVSLKKPQETINTKDPDLTLHEVEKWMRLAMQGNPTILEYLWLDNYETLTQEGEWLIDIRKQFLSLNIRNSYGGYAFAQAKRLMQSGLSYEFRSRYAKHARHCFRLLDQGGQLLTTQSLDIKVSNRDELFELGNLPPAELYAKFETRYEEFKALESDLPVSADYETINQLLIHIRGL